MSKHNPCSQKSSARQNTIMLVGISLIYGYTYNGTLSGAQVNEIFIFTPVREFYWFKCVCMCGCVYVYNL